MKLIDKDALIAEIKRRMDENRGKQTLPQYFGMIEEDLNILSFIDTLEVKEVDLDSERRKYLTEHFNVYEDGILQSKRSNLPLDTYDVIKLAKHFFELGLKARIDKELVEEVYSHIDGIKDTADRMTSGNFMHNKAAIKFSANTIAKVLELMGLKAQKGE